ncbi:MAG: hypothetical protein ACLT8E_07285 [Akkermansia sp.]
MVVLGVIAALRFTKGIIPLRTYESRELPGFPGPAGLIHRLDGAEKRQRKLEKARFPGVDENGFISLPPAWEGKVTAGRLACVAHTWAMSKPWSGKTLSRPKPANRRASRHDDSLLHSPHPAGDAGHRAVEVPDCAGYRPACWAFFTFSALPTQFREWKAAEIAKSGLKEAGLWPRLSSDAGCGTMPESIVMVHVAGFRRILPR